MSIIEFKSKAKAECMEYYKEFKNKREDYESKYFQDVSAFLQFARVKTLTNITRSELCALIGTYEGNFSNFINSKNRKNKIPYNYAFWIVLSTASSYDQALVLMAKSGNIMDDSNEPLCLSRALFLTLCGEENYKIRLDIAKEIIAETPYYDFFTH